MSIPFLKYEDKQALNRLTAYNRDVLSKRRARRCGCFHCGSQFKAEEITEWMHEEDGEESALCPYCGVDAVVYGTAQYELCTALLSQLYMAWFKEEYDERKRRATYIPSFKDDDSFLRTGAPFLMESEESVETLGEVELFPMYMSGSALGSCWKNKEMWDFPPTNKEHGGVYRIIRHVLEEYDEYGDMQSFDYYEFVDERNHRVRIEPFGGKDISLLDCCYRECNGAIRGVMLEPYASRLRITTLPDA